MMGEHSNIKRILDLDVGVGRSAFLWGPRQTGKSTYLRMHFPNSLRFDYLRSATYMAHLRRPAQLRDEIAAGSEIQRKLPIIVDEVQKIPAVLDEIHAMIEDKGWQFILCGSSARKLKRGRGNLLGGRAWRYQMFPLVTAEVDQWDLLKVLNRGLLPAHWLEGDHRRSLEAYLSDYLKEEVFAEGLVRNVPAFSRFFESLAYAHGSLINYTKIAADVGVAAKTVKSYFQILEDTLLGYHVFPYARKTKRSVLTRMPKFYLFDVGVAGQLSRRQITSEQGLEFGSAFEHFILMELKAHSSYSTVNYDIHFWRTKAGLEVDFILDRGRLAIEVKAKSIIRNQDLRPLKAFYEEHKPQRSILIYTGERKMKMGNIEVYPYRDFLQELWSSEL